MVKAGSLWRARVRRSRGGGGGGGCSRATPHGRARRSRTLSGGHIGRRHPADDLARFLGGLISAATAARGVGAGRLSRRRRVRAAGRRRRAPSRRERPRELTPEHRAGHRARPRPSPRRDKPLGLRNPTGRDRRRTPSRSPPRRRTRARPSSTSLEERVRRCRQHPARGCCASTPGASARLCFSPPTFRRPGATRRRSSSRGANRRRKISRVDAHSMTLLSCCVFCDDCDLARPAPRVSLDPPLTPPQRRPFSSSRRSPPRRTRRTRRRRRVGPRTRRRPTRATRRRRRRPATR